MKQIILIPAVLGLASALLFSSCGKEQCPTAVSEGSRMKIEVSTASEKTILVDGLQPYLDKNDVVFVGGVNGEGVYTKHEFSPESQDYADPSSQTSWPATSASFISKDVWPSGVTPVYATCNYASTSVSFTDGKIKTMVGTGSTGGTQKISKSGSYATRAACHVGKFDNEGRLQTLKNVNALLGFKLSSSGVSSVKIESVGGETISGYVVVDYEKLAAGNADFFTVPSDNKNTVITVTSSLEENVFPVGEIIYVSLIPHTYAGGLKFTMTKTDGASAEKIISSSLTFKPGKVRNINDPVDTGLTYQSLVEGTLPDEFTVDLNFDSNPFLESVSAKSSQTVDGETYTYRLDLGTEGANHYYKDLSFGIFKGPNGNTYSIASGYLGFDRISGKMSLGGIALPAIPGYYLKKVKVTNPMSTYTLAVTKNKLTDYDSLTSALVAYNAATTNKETEIVSFNDESGIVAGTPYYLYRRPASSADNNQFLRFSDIKITWAKTLPSASLPESIVMTMADSNYKNASGNLKPRSTYTTGEFWHVDYPDYKFSGTACIWNSYLGVKNGTALKLPKIDNYKLTKIVVDKFLPSTNSRNAKIAASAGTYAEVDAVSGGEEIALINTMTAAEMTWNLTDTYDANRDYYMLAASELGMQWTLTYTLASSL